MCDAKIKLGRLSNKPQELCWSSINLFCTSVGMCDAKVGLGRLSNKPQDLCLARKPVVH